MGRRRVPVVALVAAVVAVAATLVLVPLARPAAAGGACHRGYQEGQTEGTGATVEMTGNCFGPTVLRVEPGTEVTFVNRDQVVHRVDGVGWGSDEVLDAGDVATHRFDTAGTYPYSCNLHPGMSGVVVVGSGAGSGRVVEVTPVTALVSAPTPAPAAGDDRQGGAGLPVALGVAALAGAGVGAAGYALGRRRRARA